MKYVVTWQERPAGSFAEYEAAHARILDVLESREMPGSLTVRESVVRLGDLGGYVVVEAEDPADLQVLTAACAPFNSTVAPVEDAVANESRAVEMAEALLDA
ncbi:DUF3303 domain-containing protein [Geodermatophilus sp. SYSU D00708]